MHVLDAFGPDTVLLDNRALRRQGVPRWEVARAVERGELVRVLPGVYGRTALAPWPDQLVRDGLVHRAHVRHVQAVLLAAGPGARATGRTAAALHGWGQLVEPTRVSVVVPHHRTRVDVPGATLRRRRRGAVQLLAVLETELPVTPVVETLVDCCRSGPLVESVAVVDSALRAGATAIAELRAAVPSVVPLVLRRRVLRVLDLADARAGSVLESAMRVHVVTAGIEGWTLQQVVRAADGTRLLRADFCFEQARLLVETDGERFHDRDRDRELDNALAAAGWRVLRLTWALVVHEPQRAIELVRAALAA